LETSGSWEIGEFIGGSLELMEMKLDDFCMI
jgi:hypothetical protein